MRIAAALLMVLVGAFAAPAFGQSFLGQWTATAVTPGGNVSETLTVVKIAGGYEIKAELVGPVPEGTPQAGPGTDIVLDGDKFSYKRTVVTPDGPLVITYAGTVSGDTFTGSVNLGGFAEAPYTGVRMKRQDQGERLNHGQ
jgi:hypothetical protein